MQIRRTLWIVIGVLSFLVATGGALLGWVVYQQQSALTTRLLVIGEDTQLSVINADGTTQTLASDLDANDYRYPATSPDGRQVVYVATEDGGLTLRRLDLISGQRIDLYRSNINRPFNMAWSPDGRYVNFLLLSPTGLSLHIVPSDGSRPALLISSATTSFYAWSSSGTSLLVHLNGHTAMGGSLELYDSASGTNTPIVSDPGLFQAPAWALDGRYFYYVAQPPVDGRASIETLESQLVRVTADGKNPEVLINEKQSDLRIARAPNSNQIAYVAARLNEQRRLAWGQLKVLKEGAAEPTVLSRSDEQVGAFFWAPDGNQIAYLSHRGTFTPDGERTWHVVDLRTGAIRDYGTFTPSNLFVGFQIFFDAYLFSFSPWSPDSQSLTYGASDGVYVIDLERGTNTKIAAGRLSMWVRGQ
jgi:TolB protein